MKPEDLKALDLVANTDEVRLTAALERLRKNHYHIWKVLTEYQDHPDRLVDWRNAPERSEKWRKAIWLDEALKLLQISLED